MRVTVGMEERSIRVVETAAAAAVVLAALTAFGAGLLFVVLAGPEGIVPGRLFGVIWCVGALASVLFGVDALFRGLGERAPISYGVALLGAVGLLTALVVFFMVGADWTGGY